MNCTISPVDRPYRRECYHRLCRRRASHVSRRPVTDSDYRYGFSPREFRYLEVICAAEAASTQCK